MSFRVSGVIPLYELGFVVTHLTHTGFALAEAAEAADVLIITLLVVVMGADYNT